MSPGERRDQILVAARATFATTPYAEASVPDIGRAAGASAPLVFHYFGSKAGLYEAVVEAGLAELAARQRAADAALPPNSSTRDRVRTWVLAHLDHVASAPQAWAAGWVHGEEPPGASGVRHAAQEEALAFLADMVEPAEPRRDRFALLGFLGFVERCSFVWAADGCPADDRYPLGDAALGALEGALGDWRR